MLIQTKHFGPIEIDEERIITFKDGIPGFENCKQYLLIIDEEDTESPFCWLQSIEKGDLALALVNPFAFYPSYSPDIEDEYIQSLGEIKEGSYVIYSVVVVPEDITAMTANLKAPILINVETKKGVQVICQNEEYKIKHNIYAELEKSLSQKEGE